MTHAITVYDGPMLEWPDSEYALDMFPSATVGANDDEAMLDVLNRALAAVNDGAGSRAPWGRPLALNNPVWLAFVDPADDATAPRKWRTLQYFYGVTVDGRLTVADWYGFTMTVGDVRRAGESGYLSGNWNRVVVLVPEGLGGGGEVVSAFVDFLQAVGFNTAAGLAATPVIAMGERLRRRVFNDRRAREVAENWHEQGLDGPWTLTDWVDTKTAWDPAEVAKRLRLTGEEAVSLLKAMGYERSTRLGAWTVGTSKKAVKQRKRWDANAQKEWQRPRRR